MWGGVGSLEEKGIRKSDLVTGSKIATATLPARRAHTHTPSTLRPAQLGSAFFFVEKGTRGKSWQACLGT